MSASESHLQRTSQPPAIGSQPKYDSASRDESSLPPDTPGDGSRLTAAREWFTWHRASLATCLTSLSLHAIILVVLALIVVPGHFEEEVFALLVPGSTVDQDVESDVEINVQPEELVPADVNDAKSSIEALDLAETPSPIAADLTIDPIAAAMDPIEADTIIRALRGDLGGRSERGKLAALRKYGGTADSERAVSSGLRWLASIQAKDGSWDFAEVGKAGDPGRIYGGQMGATAMSLMCFLGAGHTHKSDTIYRKNVEKGLSYLIKNARFILKEADLRGDVSGNGGMYIQGLATIALCEAHALTRRRSDRKLKQTAQAAIRFIEEAQHRDGGGWRYAPREAGDTSVVGWQIMALKSAQAGQLRVKSETFSKARRFLNSVQVDDGAMYGYTTPQANRPGTTSIGLLCRMYMGWKRDREALRRGVAFLSKRGPAPDDSYYNYYATQVLHHWGGDEWKKWNEVMRPQLVSAQVRQGPGAGSWDPVDRHAGQGGRIYETTLAIMTLEVYYRHLPLYRRDAMAGKAEAVGE